MASTVRTESTDLRQSGSSETMRQALEPVRKPLFNEPFEFSFFQAVRLLERLYPEREPVGKYANPADEVVRFGAFPSLDFPASEIQDLRQRPETAPLMTVNFMGVCGPLGALPTHFTDLVRLRTRHKDTGLQSFYDLFNHRLISFFYQAWEKQHFTVGYERDRNDPVTRILYALVGMGTAGLRDRQPVRDELFVFYAGLFGLAPKPAVALEAMLGDYFNVDVEVVPFVGVWRKLGTGDLCEIGNEAPDAGTLGFGAVAGDEVWDQQSRVRLRIGPLTAARYRDFLPTGSAWPALNALVRAFCGNDLEFEVQLILKREEVPRCELGKLDVEGPQLGWYTWMKSGHSFNRDPDDTILLLLEA